MLRAVAISLSLAMGLTGCIAKTALDVVTAPVRVASKAVDLATTSQSEADEKRGRSLRQRDEELGKLEREWQRERRDCVDGDNKACREAEALAGKIRARRDRPF